MIESSVAVVETESSSSVSWMVADVALTEEKVETSELTLLLVATTDAARARNKLLFELEAEGRDETNWKQNH